MVAHLKAMQQSWVESCTSPNNGKLSQFLGRLPPRVTQHRVAGLLRHGRGTQNIFELEKYSFFGVHCKEMSFLSLSKE